MADRAVSVLDADRTSTGIDESLRAEAFVSRFGLVPNGPTVFAPKVQHVVGAQGHARIIVPTRGTGLRLQTVSPTLAGRAGERRAERLSRRVGGHGKPSSCQLPTGNK
jgi:hypothetical protein